jgi:hypothetical protein
VTLFDPHQKNKGITSKNIFKSIQYLPLGESSSYNHVNSQKSLTQDHFLKGLQYTQDSNEHMGFHPESQSGVQQNRDFILHLNQEFNRI